jgi:hypothetical protein
MNPQIPRCQRCGTNIPPEEAVPYLDSFGHPIQGVYRNWCLTHWSQRLGALPPSHPDFFKPIDARTRRKDKQYLSQMVGYASLHGQSPTSQHLRTFEPSPAPRSESKRELPHPSATDIMTLMRGQVSLFPEFERLGKWLDSMTSDELHEMYKDIEDKQHA